MKLEIGEAEQTIRNFFSAYLERRCIDDVAVLLADDIQWVGTGKFEVVHNRQGALRLLSDELAEESTPYRISFQNLHEHLISEQCAVLICDLIVTQSGILPQDFSLEARITATCRAEPDGCKIVSIHASVAAPMQKEGEYFPLAFAQEAWREFENQISHKSVDLLGKNIPGGMIGGYMEPGFPLYFINESMLHYLGYTHEEYTAAIGGSVLNCIHAGDRDRVKNIICSACSQDQEYEVQYRMLKKDGSYIWVNDIGKKGVAENGREICLSSVRDISGEVENHEKLKAEIAEKEKQAKRYDHLFQSVLCGIVQYRFIADGILTFKDANREAMRIFGYEPQEFWSRKEWLIQDLIAEEDRSHMMSLVLPVDKVGESRSFEYRLRQKNGSPCWIIGSAEVICDVDGEILIQSVFLDIDHTKKAELRSKRLWDQVQAGNELLRTALEHTTTCDFYYYPLESLCMIPERTCAYYHCDERYEGMPASFSQDFIAPEFHTDYLEIYCRIENGEKTASTEFRTLDGSFWCRVTLTIMSYTEDNRPLFAVGIVEDITKEKEMAFALEEARSRDRLTGLYNSEAGVSIIRRYMKKKDPRQSCVLMLLDMDSFDRINQEEGTIFADAILQDIAAILTEEAGADGVPVRLGGDEFMLFLKNCGRKEAVVTGTRISDRVKGLYGKGSRGIPVSVSIGMCATAAANEYNGLYRCAESTLSYIKEHGKGSAACYLDVSDELGTALTQIYTGEYLFNNIDSQTAYPAEDIMDFALELLGRSKKLDDAIFLLLSRIGNRYGFDRVSVFEANPDYYSICFSYQWAKNKIHLQTGQEIYLSREQYNCIPALYDEEGLYESPLGPRAAMRSCLQAAVWNQGVYAGALAFECMEENYSWTDDQRKLAKEITKLISSFVMKARADTVSQAKSEFLSRMSHEIRTPMNAISGMTTIAKAVLGDREKALDCLNKIDSANQYLLSLINDILVMSRIESGKMSLNIESANVKQLLQNLNALLSPQAAGKDVSLSFNNGFNSTRSVMMDVLRLNQILINIIGNAIKFTPATGSVTVTVMPVESSAEQVFLRFSVKDTGIGIGKEALGRIFNVFEQGSRDTSAQYGGTGLGLSISCRLVQMMGGMLEVNSEIGQGSEFYFTLPFSLGPEESTAPPTAPPPQNLIEEDFKGKRLLLAEDNDLNREIAVSILEMHGFLLETAEDGAKAVELFSHHDPGYYDAILMDIRMPIMDGLTATRRIRTLERPDSRSIPIIAMTANAFDEDSRKSIESGMNGHITKPIVVDRLIELLKQNLRPKNTAAETTREK